MSEYLYPKKYTSDKHWHTVYDTHHMYQVDDLYHPAKNGEWISACPINGGCGFQQLDKDGVVDSVNFRGYSIRYAVFEDTENRVRTVTHYRKCSSPTCGHAINQSTADSINAFLRNVEPKKITMADVDEWYNELFN